MTHHFKDVALLGCAEGGIADLTARWLAWNLPSYNTAAMSLEPLLILYKVELSRSCQLMACLLVQDLGGFRHTPDQSVSFQRQVPPSEPSLVRRPEEYCEVAVRHMDHHEQHPLGSPRATCIWGRGVDGCAFRYAANLSRSLAGQSVATRHQRKRNQEPYVPLHPSLSCRRVTPNTIRF